MEGLSQTLPQAEIYLSHHLIIALLVVEVIVLFLIFLFVMLRHIYSYFSSNTEREERDKIFYALCQSLESGQKEPLAALKPYAGTQLLLKEVEAFSERLSGGEWEHLKGTITSKYLRPEANKHFESRSWMNRNFAARVLALTAYPEDQPLMLKLLEDPVFLVRSHAARALACLKTPEGILKLLKHMCKEFGYARCYFRDLLVENESEREFVEVQRLAQDEIKEIALQPEKERGFLMACLDIMAYAEMPITSDVLQEALRLRDGAIDRAVIKVYAKNPQVGSEAILLEAMGNPDEEIRFEAAEGLEHFNSEVTLEALQKALNDPVWRVRLAAAQSLKGRGPEGQKILRHQQKETHPLMWEAAQYALQFD